MAGKNLFQEWKYDFEKSFSSELSFFIDRKDGTYTSQETIKAWEIYSKGREDSLNEIEELKDKVEKLESLLGLRKYLTQISKPLSEKKRGKKERVLKKTCSGVVFTRIMKELKIDLYDINAATNVPVSTLFDWKNGVIPSNPEQLETVIQYLQKFDEKITFSYFFFGTDQDREELKRKLSQAESEKRKLEFENYNLKTQLSFLEAN